VVKVPDHTGAGRPRGPIRGGDSPGDRLRALRPPHHRHLAGPQPLPQARRLGPDRRHLLGTGSRSAPTVDLLAPVWLPRRREGRRRASRPARRAHRPHSRSAARLLTWPTRAIATSRPRSNEPGRSTATLRASVSSSHARWRRRVRRRSPGTGRSSAPPWAPGCCRDWRCSLTAPAPAPAARGGRRVDNPPARRAVAAWRAPPSSSLAGMARGRAAIGSGGLLSGYRTGPATGRAVSKKSRAAVPSRVPRRQTALSDRLRSMSLSATSTSRPSRSSLATASSLSTAG